MKPKEAKVRMTGSVEAPPKPDRETVRDLIRDLEEGARDGLLSPREDRMLVALRYLFWLLGRE